jgi:hypothetical protein
VKNQTIDDVGFTIASSGDSTVQGFIIRSNMKVEFFPENLSEKFPKLIGVHIRRCPLKSIDQHHFKGFHHLVYINLAFNKIDKVDSNAFKDNVKLKYLALSYTNIKFLSGDLFSSLNNLKTLFLDGNQIHFVDPHLFKNTTNLEHVSFKHNQLKFLHPETFAALPNLKNFSIAYNQFESIDGSLLGNNKKLERLWLDFNKLKSIDARIFDGQESLLFVELSNNTCIDGYFNSSMLSTMKTEIREKCPTFESLKTELRNVTVTLLSQVDSLEVQMTRDKAEREAEEKESGAKIAEFQTQVANLTAILNSKEKELDQYGQEKGQLDDKISDLKTKMYSRQKDSNASLRSRDEKIVALSDEGKDLKEKLANCRKVIDTITILTDGVKDMSSS